MKEELKKVKEEVKKILERWCRRKLVPTGDVLGTTQSGETMMKHVVAFDLTDIVVVPDCERWDAELGERYWWHQGGIIRERTHNVVPVDEDINRVLFYLRSRPRLARQ